MKSDVTVMSMEYDNNSWNIASPAFIEKFSLSHEQERSLKFACQTGNELDLPFLKKAKVIRDPLSHRIVEKRRRDRMNNCLADLSRLIPPNYLKQGQGRIEKTEIIGIAIQHIKNLTNIVNKQDALKSSLPDRYLGFKECQDEVMRYLVEVEGWDAQDQLCSRMMSHLEQAGEKFRIMNDDSLSRDAKEEQYRHVEESICPNQPSQEQAGVQSVNYGQNMPSQLSVTTSTSLPLINRFPLPVINCPEPFCAPMQVTCNGFEAFANAQQITEKQLKQDNHLWSVATSNLNRDDSGFSTGRESVTSGMRIPRKYSQPSNGKVGQIPQSGMTCNRTSITSSTCTSVDTNSDKNDRNVYKFKHSITKRFSEEKKMMGPSVASSLSSSKDKPLKRKLHQSCCHSPSSSNSSRHPNSDTSNDTGSAIGESCSNTGESKPIFVLPGFVLHPNGTHYVPLSIHPSNIGNYLFPILPDVNCIFHPISIPVNFGGSTLHIKKAGIKQNQDYVVPSLNSTGSSDTSSQDGMLSVSNLSTCLSNSGKNSPASEQESLKSN